MTSTLLRSGLVLVFLIIVGVQVGSILAGDSAVEDYSTWLKLALTLVAAALVIPIGFWFLKKPAHLRKEFRGAPTALGTLVGVRATGVELNDQPELELTVDVVDADGRGFRSTTTSVIDLGTLPQLVPGAAVPVLYLPDGRIALSPQTATEKLAELYYARAVRTGTLTPQQVEVARHGVEAKALVLSCTPTGEVVDGKGIVRLGLRVTRPEGTSFDAVREMPLATTALPGVQPGAVVDVSYLPRDESFVAVSVRVR